MMRRPVSVDPVNAMRSTSGWAASAWPASLPRPVTTLTTPAGIPASCRISATRSTDSEASSDGFSTAVHPLASTAPMIQNWLLSGPFQGMIPPMTPTGAFSVMVVTLPGMPFISVSPVMFAACEAKKDSIFIRAGLVLRNLETGAPMSMASIWISSSNRSSRTWAMRVSSAWRSYGVQVLHCTVERFARSADRAVDVGLVTGSKPRQDLTGRRIDGGQRLPGRSRHPLAVDEQMVHVAGQKVLGLLAQSDVLLGCGHCFPLTWPCRSVDRTWTPLPIWRWSNSS